MISICALKDKDYTLVIVPKINLVIEIDRDYAINSLLHRI